jgi:hypothetical protein
MKIRELLVEGLDRKNTYSILHKFVKFAAEHLDLKTLPKFEFKFDNQQSVENSSFGGYGGHHISISVGNRHIMDVCRTLAHELVHYKQDLNHELEGDNPGATGSPQENEANAEAAVIMRNWGKLHPKLFSLRSIE